RVLGDLGMLACATWWAAYTVVNKRLQTRAPIALIGYLFGLGALVLIPLATLDVASGGRFHPTLRSALAIAYLAAVIYVLGFVVWIAALRRLEAATVGAFYNLTPVVGVGVAALALGEAITPAHLVGGGLVLLGVWLAAQAGRPSRARPAAPLPNEQ